MVSTVKKKKKYKSWLCIIKKQLGRGIFELILKLFPILEKINSLINLN